jgi:hypothetical protein
MSLADVLRRILVDLSELDVGHALVGGLAVSVRTEPRFTRDVDVAVAVPGDRDAERLVSDLAARGYRVLAQVEQENRERLATARLLPPGRPDEGLIVDLLFASSGIEQEIVEEAEPVEVLPDLRAPVATLPHLIALKTLSRDDATRPQDRADLRALLDIARREDVQRARVLLSLVSDRGFHRGRDLLTALDQSLD